MDVARSGCDDVSRTVETLCGPIWGDISFGIMLGLGLVVNGLTDTTDKGQGLQESAQRLLQNAADFFACQLEP